MDIQSIIQEQVMAWMRDNKEELRKIVEEICEEKITNSLESWRENTSIHEAGFELDEKIREIIINDLAKSDIKKIAKQRVLELAKKIEENDFSLEADWYC